MAIQTVSRCFVNIQYTAYTNIVSTISGMYRDHLDILVDSLKQLKELRVLKLSLPEILRDEHLIIIIDNLAHLEDLDVSGLELNDVVLRSLAKLSNLRNVTLSGISKFTVDGLLDFVSQLGPSNHGIRVTIDMADPDTLLAEESLAVVRECLMEKTGGNLEYMALRGMQGYLLNLNFTLTVHV